MAFVGFGQQVAQTVEAPFPSGALCGEPTFCGRQALRREAADSDPANLLGVHDPGRFEDSKMLNDRRQ
jgi:hypothetical protein